MKMVPLISKWLIYQLPNHQDKINLKLHLKNKSTMETIIINSHLKMVIEYFCL